MKIEQIYTGCLAQGAYYIESAGEAVIIDPLREVSPYIEKAKNNNAKIKYVFETHFHADFVSGHIDLAKETGATIIYGPTANPGFEAHIAKDGEVFKIGNITITVLHTPGHTMESSCYLLKDEKGKEVALFTGDTLFIGDVGRPDLAQKTGIITKEELAGTLYESLRNKIMPLPDHILIYPAHGAGSACGKNMSKETFDTLKHQKETNYALRADMKKEEFIKEVTDGLLPPPSYFPMNVELNKGGYESIAEVMKRGNRAMDPDAFEKTANDTGALILDTRDPQEFAKEFIPNSINIGIDGSFAPWVGTMVPDIRQEILIVAEDAREEEVVTRLSRVGYDNAIGYLNGGLKPWKKSGKETDSIKSITATALAVLQKKNEQIKIIDVRKETEFESEHIVDAENVPLDRMNDMMQKIDKEKPYYIHCAGGYRSMIFASIMRARGFDNMIDVKGGFKEIKESGKFKTSEKLCKGV